MSREILFRGKSVVFDDWVEGDLLNYSPNPKICVTRNEEEDKDLYFVLKETVGEYTGLTDKNGKKIFEGDIIICKKEICGNFIDSCVEIGFVEMKHGAFGLHRKQGYYRPFKDWLEDYEYEMIGNIHDNPELLEVSE